MKKTQLPTQRLINAAFSERGIPDVIMWEVFPVSHLEKLLLTFESTGSSWRQGVWMKTDGGLIINNTECPSAEIWVDTAPPLILIECKTTDGRLHLYNIWDRGLGKNSQAWSSGMKAEKIANGYRYFCNDIGFESEFRKLIFRLERQVEHCTPTNAAAMPTK